MLSITRQFARLISHSSILKNSKINPAGDLPISLGNTEKQNSGNIAEKKKPIPIVLLDKDLEESFVKGSGPGGQKINKNKSCVQLKHIPTGIMVETQRFRELVNNRKEARKLLTLKLDRHFNGRDSKLEIKYEKIKKQLAKKKQRAKAKYGKKDDETDGSANQQ